MPYSYMDPLGSLGFMVLVDENTIRGPTIQIQGEQQHSMLMLRSFMAITHKRLLIRGSVAMKSHLPTRNVCKRHIDAVIRKQMIA